MRSPEEKTMTPAKNDSPLKSYWEMTTEELREATREFDDEFVIDTFRELTPEERAEWEKKRNQLQSTQRPLFCRVNLALTQELLADIDRLSAQHKISRSKLVRIALRQFTAKKRSDAAG
jgi:hypothetical protein